VTRVSFFFFIDPAKYYFAMKAYRRLASRFAKDETNGERSVPLSLSPCVKRQLTGWLDEAISNVAHSPVDLSKVDAVT
jgi:hypothetical protein